MVSTNNSRVLITNFDEERGYFALSEQRRDKGRDNGQKFLSGHIYKSKPPPIRHVCKQNRFRETFLQFTEFRVKIIPKKGIGGFCPDPLCQYVESVRTKSYLYIFCPDPQSGLGWLPNSYTQIRRVLSVFPIY